MEEQKQKIFFWLILYLGISSWMGISVYPLWMGQSSKKEVPTELKPCSLIYPSLPIHQKPKEDIAAEAAKQMAEVTRVLDSIYQYRSDNHGCLIVLGDTFSRRQDTTLIPTEPNPYYLTFDEQMENEKEEMIPIVSKNNTPVITEIFISEPQPESLNLDEVKKMIGYPQIARDAGIGGMVILRVTLDEKGFYKDHQVIKSVHPILDRAVEKHIKKIRFKPYYLDEKAYPQTVNIPFTFYFLK